MTHIHTCLGYTVDVALPKIHIELEYKFEPFGPPVGGPFLLRKVLRRLLEQTVSFKSDLSNFYDGRWTKCCYSTQDCPTFDVRDSFE